MTSEWREVRLGELCVLTKGKSATLKTPPGDYPLIVTGPAPLSSNEYQFDGEAVCIPMVSSTGHGHASLKRVHYARGKFAVANIITAAQVIDSTICDTKYLFHCLQHFKDELIVSRMQGTANVSISQKVLAEIPVVIPSLPEQRRIVDLIGAMDDAIDAADEHAGTLAQAATALRGQIFTGLFESNSSVSAGGFFEVTLGRQKSARQIHGDHEIPYIRAANIGVGRTIVSDVQQMNFDLKEQQKYCLQQGDVLVVEGGSIGQTAVWNGEIDGPVGFDKHVLRLRGRSGRSASDYANHWSQWCYETGKYAAEARGVTIKALGHQRASDMPVPDISLDKQAEVASLLDGADQAAISARSQTESLRALRTELLTSLLSGAHTIPESYDQLLSA